MCPSRQTHYLLHILLFASTVLFVFKRVGAFSATLLAIGLVALFPFAAAFLPGEPDRVALSQGLAFWSVLPLLAARNNSHSTP